MDDKEVLTPPQRMGEGAAVVGLLLVSGYLALHQVTGTGFFTSEFGQLEMLCLYGPIVLALIAPIVRAWRGRRNPARPPEAIASLALGMGSLWLLTVFPFEFAHLGDVLPRGLRFLLGWVTNGMGRIPLIAQVVIGPIAALLTTWKYLSLRWRERTSASPMQS